MVAYDPKICIRAWPCQNKPPGRYHGKPRLGSSNPGHATDGAITQRGVNSLIIRGDSFGPQSESRADSQPIDEFWNIFGSKSRKKPPTFYIMQAIWMWAAKSKTESQGSDVDAKGKGWRLSDRTFHCQIAQR